jgi:hypothetical protein
MVLNRSKTPFKVIRTYRIKQLNRYVSPAHALSPAPVLSFDSDDYDRSSDNKKARMVRTARHYLLQWLATIGWPSALVAMMHNHAIPRGCRPASRTSTPSIQPVLPTLQIHAYRPCENYSPTFFRLDILSDPV